MSNDESFVLPCAVCDLKGRLAECEKFDCSIHRLWYCQQAVRRISELEEEARRCAEAWVDIVADLQDKIDALLEERQVDKFALCVAGRALAAPVSPPPCPGQQEAVRTTAGILERFGVLYPQNIGI